MQFQIAKYQLIKNTRKLIRKCIIINNFFIKIDRNYDLKIIICEWSVDKWSLDVDILLVAIGLALIATDSKQSIISKNCLMVNNDLIIYMTKKCFYYLNFCSLIFCSKNERSQTISGTLPSNVDTPFYEL